MSNFMVNKVQIHSHKLSSGTSPKKPTKGTMTQKCVSRKTVRAKEIHNNKHPEEHISIAVAIFLLIYNTWVLLHFYTVFNTEFSV